MGVPVWEVLGGEIGVRVGLEGWRERRMGGRESESRL